MPVYPKGDKWRVRIWHKGTRQDFIQEGTKQEATAFEARKRVELEAIDPRTATRSVPVFSTFSTGAYSEHAKRHLAKRTWSNRTYTLATLIDHFGGYKLTEIGLGIVETYKHRRLDLKIRPSTINDELKVLRAVLAYARGLGVPCSTAKFKDVPARGARKRRILFWNTEQVEDLLTAVREKSPDIEGLVVFLLNTGCRKGEAIAIEWRNVDLKSGLVRIEPSDEWQPKDDEPREIPISDALRPWLTGKKKHKRWVFPSSDGDRFAYWPQRSFDRAREAAKLKGGPHTTRHTFATHFLHKRPDLFLLGRILGHSHAYMTEQYAHLLPDHLAMARNVVCLGTNLRALEKSP